MKQNTMIYPFDWEALPLLRNNAFPEHINIGQCIAPAGWGYAGKDVGSIDLGEPLGITVGTDFSAGLAQVDTVLISKSVNKLDREHLLIKIRQAIDNKKNVICTIDLSREERDSVKDSCINYGCSFDYYNNNFSHKNNINKEIFEEQNVYLKEINTPIVMVFGLTQRVGNFDTQLKLARHFQKLGYKSTLVSSRSYGELCNACPSPFFMFSKEFTSAEKIILFNHYIKSIEKKYLPDVIIIGVPGGLMPVTKRDTSNFGELAFKMTRAVTPDVSIICTHSIKFTPRYFEEITPLLTHRFSIDIIGYLVDSTSLDFMTGENVLDAPTLTFIEDDIAEAGIPPEVKHIVFSRQNRDGLFGAVVKKLTDYGELESN